MNTLLKPYWIFIAITIPQIILALLYFASYRIIGTLLTESNQEYWIKYGIVFGMLFFASTLYGVIATLKKKQVHLLAALAFLISYIIFLYAYSVDINKIIPWGIPRWMLFQGDLQLYVYTFTMPALLYSLLITVMWATPVEKRYRAWISFVSAAIIPLSWYLIFNLGSVFRANGLGESAVHIIIILFISSTTLFLFFLIRWAYIVITNSNKRFKKFELLWKIPVAIVFPLLGLALNNGAIDFSAAPKVENIFGDLNSSWFYVLAIVNGIVICLPSFTNPINRLSVLVLRSFTYSYTFYFFLVLLPWFPLSVAAVIALGLGFLMLTPLVLMVIHTQAISNDYKALQSHYSKTKLRIFTGVAMVIIPSVLVMTNLNDRMNLHKGLDYVYAPDLSKPSPDINTQSIMRTLDVIHKNKSRNAGFLIDNNDIPYLSSFYRWLVLDNLTLSDKKISLLEQVFTGKITQQEDNTRWSWRRMPDYEPMVKIDSVKTSTAYNERENLWKTQVDLTITNHTNGRKQFSTEIQLPDGCWISDYYLVVDSVKKKGLLSEKQAAMWVYQQIVSTNRDPGILYYQHGNRVSFKVFPFNSNETRYTGIEFIHKEPLAIQIDSSKILLGDTLKRMSLSIAACTNGLDAIYIPYNVKTALPKVERKPYYHFIVDMSEGSNEKREEQIKNIDDLLRKDLIDANGSKITFSNYRAETIDMGEDWKQKLNAYHTEGGFFAEQAFSRALFEQYKQQANTYPVFVLVTDSIEHAIFTGALEDMQFTFPETDLFYVLNSQGNLSSHSLINNPTKEIIADVRGLAKYPVYEYRDKNLVAYLPINNFGSYVIPERESFTGANDFTDKSFNSAMTLQALWQHSVLHPEQAEGKWLELVQGSFRTQIMTPVTSYIVVENVAQEQALLEKQKQILDAKKSLDADEDIHVMSEPSLWLLLLAFIPIVWNSLKRKKLFLKHKG